MAGTVRTMTASNKTRVWSHPWWARPWTIHVAFLGEEGCRVLEIRRGPIDGIEPGTLPMLFDKHYISSEGTLSHRESV